MIVYEHGLTTDACIYEIESNRAFYVAPLGDFSCIISAIDSGFLRIYLLKTNAPIVCQTYNIDDLLMHRVQTHKNFECALMSASCTPNTRTLENYAHCVRSSSERVWFVNSLNLEKK